jgi:hypothetical protein
MNTFFKSSILTLLIALGGCGSGSTDTSTTTPTTTTTGTISAASCSAPLVSIQTGSDASCKGGGLHFYPVGMGAGACHGWRSVDTAGKLHDNSANNIRCNGDGSFSFDQYADSISCNGALKPTTKTFFPGKCDRDIPPTLYSIPADLSCCSATGSSSCKTGVPSVSVAGSSIYLNNQQCVQ